MIPVSMGKEDGINSFHPLAQHLLPKIGARIDDKTLIGNFDLYRGTQSLIAKIQ
jgi:hypothetical protein